MCVTKVSLSALKLKLLNNTKSKQVETRALYAA